jgi:iron complex outermembrane receptor protein
LVISGALLILTPTVKFTGSPLLQPVVVTNYEIAWDRVLAGSHFLFRSAVFHQHNENLVGLVGKRVVTLNGPYFVPSNIGNSDANGLELGLKATLAHNLGWGVQYRPEWISDQFVPAAQNGAAYADYQQTTPVHLAKANLGWGNGSWEIDGYLGYQSKTYGLQLQPTGATAPVPVPAFAALDGRLAYKLTKRVTASVSGQNLTHANQVQTGGPTVERRVLGSMSIHF